MARREQTGTGGVRRGSNGGAGAGRGRKTRKGRKTRATHHTARHASQANQASQAKQARPASRAMAPAAAHPTGVSVWHSVTGAASLSPLLALAADHAPPEVALTLVGAEQTTLGAALQAWGAARDLATNRAWRRPGGLTRMAGL